MKAALYLRVSTDEQTVENQRQELLRVLTARGWTLTKEFSDHGISGAKSRDKRPQFDALIKAATRREFDVIVAWSVDRISRSLGDLINFMNDLHAVNVQLYVHQQAFDTTTPSGKLMFQVAGAFAEFEREIIRQRVMIGVRRAKAQGKQWGQKLYLTPYVIQRIVELRASEDPPMSAKKIGEKLKLSERSVWRGMKQAGISTARYLE